MVKAVTSIRIEEELVAKIDVIAASQYGNNRNAAIEDALMQFVERTARCPRCGTIPARGDGFCAECGLPLTPEACEQVERLKRDLVEHPEIVAEALQEYIENKKREGR